MLEAIDARLGKSLPGKSHFLKLLSVVWITHFGGQFAALGRAQAVVGDFEHVAVPLPRILDGMNSERIVAARESTRLRIYSGDQSH